MHWKRHTLIDISDTGREAILAELAGSGADRAMLREKFGRVLLPEMAGVRVPGIVRREDVSPRSGCVPVGFSALLSDGALRADPLSAGSSRYNEGSSRAPVLPPLA
jgi:hypothetical protein